MSYLDALARELTAAGIRGRRRERILAEFADHLDCDPSAQLGEPPEVARRFADELGTVLARRAAFQAFAALAIAGVLFGALALTGSTRPLASISAERLGLGYIGAGMALIGCQVAFVAGVLAALRAVRRRRTRVVSRDEAVVIVRRAGVGLLAGAVTMTGLGLAGFALRHHAASWWTTGVLMASGLSIIALAAAAPAVVAAGRLRPVAGGSMGGIDDDLGPFVPSSLQGRPWRFALAVAAILAIVIGVAGVVQSDPFDGALRGIMDGAACLAGFGLLGRYLGLRS